MATKKGFEVPVVTGNEVEDLRRLTEMLVEQNNSLLNMVNNSVIKNPDGSVHIDGDVFVKDLITDFNSIYIGEKKVQNKLENLNRTLYFNKRKLVGNAGEIGEHASQHESGGVDETNHDSLAGFVANEHLPGIDEDNMASDSASHVPTQQSTKAYVDAKTVDVPIALTDYDPSPARGSESNVHGGILSLAQTQSLDSVTPINVTKGIGKLMLVINGGSALDGSVTVTGETINRETGASTPGDTESLNINGTTTDSSTADSNGNTVHGFSVCPITSKWFTGSITISTTDINASDIDVYHVSFEQFNDSPNITVETFDANLYSTNVNAEFDAYLYTLEVTGNVCTISKQAELHLGADGETAIANKYWRLRRGNINKALNGTTDGIWIDVHYSNSPAYIEDVTLKVWAKRTITLN